MVVSRDPASIDEGTELVEVALRRSAGAPGPYALQAAIAACHAASPSYVATDWGEIAALYSRLATVTRSPMVRLSHAVAVAELDGPGAGLALVDGITGLERQHLWHATRADLLRRLDRDSDAAEAYRQGLVHAVVPPADLEATARAWAARIAALPQAAVRATKRAVVDGLDLTLHEGLTLERRLAARVAAAGAA